MPPKKITQSEDRRGKSRGSKQALEWIQEKAHIIRRQHPSLEWKECIARASAEYRKQR